MRKEFLGEVQNKPEKVVQAFVSAKSNAESALKTKPKVSLIQHVCSQYVLGAIEH